MSYELTVSDGWDEYPEYYIDPELTYQEAELLVAETVQLIKWHLNDGDEAEAQLQLDLSVFPLLASYMYGDAWGLVFEYRRLFNLHLDGEVIE